MTVDEDPGEADLSLSLDVIFHLVEDDVFHRYMSRLFAHARRFVAIYASDQDALTPDAHVRHRNFSAWITQHAPQWQRVLQVSNPHPFDPHAPDETSFADFQLFARKVDVEPAKLPSVITDTTLQGWPVHRGSACLLLAPHPSSEDAITSFTGVGEAATLEFFDAVLPRCKRMIDVGAYVGAMSLYAASTVPEVHAIEASNSNWPYRCTGISV